jgi:UPF0755 protein
MRRKIIYGVIGLLLLVLIVAAWQFLSSATNFSEKSKYLYIRTNKASYADLLQTIKDSQLVKSPRAFDFVAKRLSLEQKIKPGRYEIKNGMSVLSIVRLLRNGRQAPVKLVITKLRTKEDLATFISKKFECDSASLIAFLNNPDSLKTYELDTSTAMTGIIPNTYELFWNSNASFIMKKLFSEKKNYWNEERKKLAAERKLNETTAYILASIVEEETRDNEEKDTIASVYLNRYYKGMRLQADPTVKFALRDFGLKRIYEKHLAVESPYNTYRNAGLPPGPICTPSIQTLEAVLHAPSTNYLYFVAKSDFSGRHVFSETYEQHLRYAKEFQQALDKQQQIKAAKEDTGSQP